jgi:membrane protease YdiL (CAAX protease family)
MNESPDGCAKPVSATEDERNPSRTAADVAAPCVDPPGDFGERESSWFHSSIWMGTAFELGLGLLAVGLGYVLSISPWENFQAGVLPILGSSLASLPLVGALALLLRSDWEMLREMRMFIDTFVLPMFANARLWELGLLCAAAGIGEELLFRGVLQPVCIKYLGVCAGVLLVNLLFSLLHPFSVAYLVGAYLIGCYLSVLYVATENLLVPMIVHGLYDFIALVWMMRLRKKAD